MTSNICNLDEEGYDRPRGCAGRCADDSIADRVVPLSFVPYLTAEGHYHPFRAVEGLNRLFRAAKRHSRPYHNRDQVV